MSAHLGFDNFVVGAGNRLAAAAARAVAESPGLVYNPLFVYGDSGLGKTHLLGGIAHLVTQSHPHLTVTYVALVDFVDQYHAAVATGSTDAWAARWQAVHVLLIDDIQFLTGQRETQSELLRLFATMQHGDRQLVMTSDRPPSEIADVDERLIARLGGGLVVDVGAPDFETRAAIVRGVAEARGYEIPDDVLDELALIEFSNVRELQGALSRLVVHRMADPASGMRADDVARALGLDIPGLGRRRSVVDFLNYLAGVSTTPVRPAISEWKVRLRDAIMSWRAEGFRTSMLERALAGPEPADVDAIVNAFGAAADHLRALERRAVERDALLAGHEVFRDPARVAEAEHLVARALAGQLAPPGPVAAMAREVFEESTSNQLAVRAVDAVIAEPGVRFNPLFMYGPAGVGKSHLLHAIGNALQRREGPGAPRVVACVPAPRFVDELIAAIGADSVEQWRARYRAVDALLLDDVQALAGKQRSQEELFHVFNALHASGKQIVFTADQPPRSIPHIEERLRTRFDGGLVVPIDAPDRTLRERLVARTLVQRGRRADADLVLALADEPARSVRDLLAVVHRIVSAAESEHASLTAAYARGSSATAARATPARPSVPVVDSVFLDREKVVWEWPDAGARLIEEPR